MKRCFQVSHVLIHQAPAYSTDLLTIYQAPACSTDLLTIVAGCWKDSPYVCSNVGRMPRQWKSKAAIGNGKSVEKYLLRATFAYNSGQH